MLHGAGELRQSGEAVQGPLGPEGLGLGLGAEHVDLFRRYQFCFMVLLEFQDEGAEVSVKQLHPLERLGPQVQIPLLKQKVLFILVKAKKKTGVS